MRVFVTDPAVKDLCAEIRKRFKAGRGCSCEQIAAYANRLLAPPPVQAGPSKAMRDTFVLSPDRAPAPAAPAPPPDAEGHGVVSPEPAGYVPPPELVEMLQAQADAAKNRAPSIWRFRPAKDVNEFGRATKFCGSFYDQYGTRIGVLGDQHIEAITAVLNGLPAPSPTPPGPESADAERARVETQIEKLAAFIIAEILGEPSQSEGAVDTAIRTMTRQREQVAALTRERDEARALVRENDCYRGHSPDTIRVLLCNSCDDQRHWEEDCDSVWKTKAETAEARVARLETLHQAAADHRHHACTMPHRALDDALKALRPGGEREGTDG